MNDENRRVPEELEKTQTSVATQFYIDRVALHSGSKEAPTGEVAEKIHQEATVFAKLVEMQFGPQAEELSRLNPEYNPLLNEAFSIFTSIQRNVGPYYTPEQTTALFARLSL